MNKNIYSLSSYNPDKTNEDVNVFQQVCTIGVNEKKTTKKHSKECPHHLLAMTVQLHVKMS